MNRKEGLIGVDPSFTGKMAGRLFLGLKCPRKLKNEHFAFQSSLHGSTTTQQTMYILCKQLVNNYLTKT